MHTALLQSTKARALTAALVAAVAIVFTLYVWPTPYRYFTIYEPVTRPVRVQRFTGRTELLGRWGWYAPKTPLMREYDSLQRLGKVP